MSAARLRQCSGMTPEGLVVPGLLQGPIVTISTRASGAKPSNSLDNLSTPPTLPDCSARPRPSSPEGPTEVFLDERDLYAPSVQVSLVQEDLGRSFRARRAR